MTPWLPWLIKSRDIAAVKEGVATRSACHSLGPALQVCSGPQPSAAHTRVSSGAVRRQYRT